ncbi:hypothetical protein A6S26_17100 [Nostoc sp. ATCC 43529]|nr:hypothetical protein A6S26_17100 [Nostoc sp. ATCC 43529]
MSKFSDAGSFQLTRTFVSPIPDAYADGTDFFGFSLDLYKKKVLIGAYGDDTGAIDTGIVHLFDVNTGKLLRTFSNPSPDKGDNFGFEVALNNKYALVGAVGDDTGAIDTGIAYLFNAKTGKLLQTFTNPNPGDGDRFGASLALDGNKILIGSPLNDTEGTDSGIAYLFDAKTGKLLQTFANPNPGIEGFGASLSFAGNNKVAIGAPRAETSPESGVVYIFDIDTGALTQTIPSPTPNDGDSFGFPVEASKDRVLIGSSRADTEIANSGIVYLYDASSGELLQKFENPTPDSGDAFSASVAIDGNNVVIGAVFDDDAGATNSGAAYLFDASTGELVQTFLNPTPNQGESFGIPVDIDKNDIVIGSPFDAIGGSIGSVTLYQKKPYFSCADGFLGEQNNHLFGSSLANNLPDING